MTDDSCGSIAVFPVHMLQRAKSSVVEKKKGILLKQKNKKNPYLTISLLIY